ncbi:MAG: glycosyltransferase [candidate division Zixibacteria bacterium]|nr:glycosyltransferase [candidate division Zixibacteria bacterium]
MPPDRTILLISYYFPPLGMGGVGRPLALYKYLPESGYKVRVLTVKNILYPEYDYSLLEGIDAANVIRTDSFDPARLLYLLGLRNTMALDTSGIRSLSRRRRPDSKRGWHFFALRKAEEIIKREKIDAVITTSPPPSSHLLGLKLKEKFNIRWVADFRDLWFSLPIEQVYAHPADQAYALDLKKMIIERADEVVSVNNDIRRYLGRGEVIMNGADIETARLWEGPKARSDDRLVIGLLGTINYLCPIEPLLKGISALIKADSKWKERLSIIHVGHCAKEAIASISRHGLEDIIRRKGYLPKGEAIKAMADCDLLYLAVEKFGGYNILPGRIFDYLISGKPILGVVAKDSDAAALLHEYPLGTVIPPEKSELIARHLEEMAGRPKIIDRSPKLDEHIKLKYSSITTAKKYAALLDRVLK